MDGAGTLTDRWALAAGRVSKKGCNICHGPRLPGARLCAPCKAALKRARLETVSDLIPRPSRAVAEAAEAARRQKKALAAAAPAAPPRRRPWLVPAVVVLAAAVAAGGYLVLRLTRSPAAHAVPAKVAPAVPGPTSSAPKPAPLAARPVDLVPEATPRATASVPGTAMHPPAIANKHRPPQKPAVEAPPVDRFPVVASLTPQPAAAPAPAAEAIPPAREAPPPDRWQVMADQIARCYGDGFFAGAICEQRVRRQYCDGYWGQVAQCRSGVVNDHGD